MTMLRQTIAFVLFFQLSPWLAAQETSTPFRKLDRNQDGKLTKDEFSGLLFDEIDADHDGIVTAEEDKVFSRARLDAPGFPLGSREFLDSIEVELNIPYAATDNPRQRLDLYLPKKPANPKPLPIVVYVHGGAWQNGDRRGGLGIVGPLVETGEYAGASLGYRLSGEAIWPAQIHDCKAAIRWLKTNAKKYNLDPDRIGVAGTSAGGHLVAMLGTSGDVAALEGTVGGLLNVDSRVHCVVDEFGPTDLLSMRGTHDNGDSPESKLVGGAIQENAEVARAASPITYVTKEDPPIMMIHGTKDPLVPFQQSELLFASLKKNGVESILVAVEGAGHGNFGTKEVPSRMKQFFDKHLLGKTITISDEPIKSPLRPR